MNSHESRSKTIFLNALEITDPAERSAFLDAQCAGDDALRSEVEALLLHHQQMGGFLNTGPVILAATIDSPELSTGRGTTIGPYKLLEKLGEGGMGVVYMAEQEQPVRRKVALKIVKPGMDTAQVVARFE